MIPMSTGSPGTFSPRIPSSVVAAIDRALEAGASLEQLAHAVAYAAALRLVRFHTQNDHGDWDVVHHAFTAANALHQCVARSPSPELARGIYQCALRVYLDRFLNVPAARLPRTDTGNGRRRGSAAGGDGGGTGNGDPDAGGSDNGDAGGTSRTAQHVAGDHGLADLQSCWDVEGRVDDAGRICFRYLAGGGDAGRLIALLGRALLTEDAEFHWFQIFEAAVRQYRAWPAGSEQGMLVLVGAARFLAAHTPTRRELSQVYRIATRLRRGEALYEEEGEAQQEDDLQELSR